jgi:hypothetical protein
MRNLSQNIQPSERDLNPKPSEYENGVLPSQPRRKLYNESCLFLSKKKLEVRFSDKAIVLQIVGTVTYLYSSVYRN